MPRTVPSLESLSSLPVGIDPPDYSPGPLIGIVAGVLLSLLLWGLVGCITLVVHLLGGAG